MSLPCWLDSDTAQTSTIHRESDMADQDKPKKPRRTTNPSGRRPGHSRTPAQRVADRAETLSLLRRGWTQTDIAAKLGVSQSQVSYDWHMVARRMARDMEEDAKHLVLLKLEEYGEIKREAWKAWEDSKREQVTLTTEETSTPASPGRRGTIRRRETSVLTPGMAGVGYLRLVLQCLEAERNLLGLDQAKKVQMGGRVTLNWDILSQGIPEDGVPDEVEAEIARAMRGEFGDDDGRDQKALPGPIAPPTLDERVSDTQGDQPIVSQVHDESEIPY
jgi:transcriptional regulator with XRE-family HTH domain